MFCFSLIETRIKISSSLCSFQSGNCKLVVTDPFALRKLTLLPKLAVSLSLSQQLWLCHLQSMNSRLVGQKAQTLVASSEEADRSGLKPQFWLSSNQMTKICALLIWVSSNWQLFSRLSQTRKVMFSILC